MRTKGKQTNNDLSALLIIRGVFSSFKPCCKKSYLRIIGYSLRGSNSVILIFTSLFNVGLLLKERICSLGADSSF